MLDESKSCIIHLKHDLISILVQDTREETSRLHMCSPVFLICLLVIYKSARQSVSLRCSVIHTFIDVGLCVGVARCLSRLPPKQTPQVGSGLVASPLIHRVTLGTFLDKHLLPFLNVPHVQQLGGEEEMVISVYPCECYSQPDNINVLLDMKSGKIPVSPKRLLT